VPALFYLSGFFLDKGMKEDYLESNFTSRLSYRTKSSIKQKEAVMETKQYKQLGCLDVAPGMGCAFQVRAETDEEVMRLAAEHGKIVHQMSSMPPDMAAKAKAAIKTVAVNV